MTLWKILESCAFVLAVCVFQKFYTAEWSVLIVCNISLFKLVQNWIPFVRHLSTILLFNIDNQWTADSTKVISQGWFQFKLEAQTELIFYLNLSIHLSRCIGQFWDIRSKFHLSTLYYFPLKFVILFLSCIPKREFLWFSIFLLFASFYSFL